MIADKGEKEGEYYDGLFTVRMMVTGDSHNPYLEFGYRPVITMREGTTHDDLRGKMALCGVDMIFDYCEKMGIPYRLVFSTDTVIEMGSEFYKVVGPYLLENRRVAITNEIGKWEMRI